MSSDDEYLEAVQRRQAIIEAARTMCRNGHLVDEGRDLYKVLGEDFRRLEHALWDLDYADCHIS